MEEQRKKILVVLAHPDDPEFFCGGTVARWTAEGHTVVYVLASRGDKGSDDPTMTGNRLAQIREAEQRAAAAALGVSGVIFMDYPDAELVPNLNLRRDITRLIRQERPDIVVTCDPTLLVTTTRINHPDHRAIGLATLDAVYPSARDRLTFVQLWRDEGWEPHAVQEVYLAFTEQPDTFVDVTDFLERKIAALREHRSQIKDMAAMEQRVRERARRTDENGQERYVEAFRRVVLA